MHHSAGALAETLFIYGEPLKEIFARISRPRIFSLGLGLGYVEMVSAAHARHAGQPLQMETRESEDVLVETLTRWLQGQGGDRETQLYSTLADEIAKPFGLGGEALRQDLLDALRSGRWVVGEALGVDHAPPSGRFHGIMYDAFSSKTSPSLWSEEFLGQILENHCSSDCLFSTYACTGNLKRSLRKQGFTLDLREGFRGKRYSTLGRRGLFAETI